MKPLPHLRRIAAALALLSPTAGGAVAATGLPDPVFFRIQMELGDIDRARAWLDAGLDPNTEGDIVGTGLMIGAWEGNIPLMELFLARGADINRSNRIGETALMLASWKGKSRAVQWLLERGARVNTGAMRWSPLHYAVFAGHRELAQTLVERGADINARSSNGSSILMMAIYEGHDDLAEWLIGKGADPAPRNDWGDSAHDWATKFGRGRVARLLAASAPAANTTATRAGEAAVAANTAARRSIPAVPPPPPADSEELRRLIQLRQFVAERNLDVNKIDNKIAAERVRLHRASVARQALPPATSTRLEIRARRTAPEDQGARLIKEAN